MDQTNKNNNPQYDDQLADFADQVMQGKQNQPASTSTDELRSLEETILRLNSTLPPTSLDDASIKQMQVRLKTRIRREEKNVKASFWEKWFGRNVSPQLGLAFAVLAILIVTIVSVPSLTAVSPSTTGTATASVNLFIAIGLAGVVLIILWVIRRK